MFIMQKVNHFHFSSIFIECIPSPREFRVLGVTYKSIVIDFDHSFCFFRVISLEYPYEYLRLFLALTLRNQTYSAPGR